MTIDWHARYEALRSALGRYDRALRAYGLMGEQWASSGQLDRLYAALLREADIDSPVLRDADPDAD